MLEQLFRDFVMTLLFRRGFRFPYKGQSTPAIAEG